ncbi:MAG: hypothetical protein IJU81_02270 [Bacteroidales bacterium]|nr:hypothetical protein [Bacteroidales bacterium]
MANLPMTGKREYTRPEASVESYHVERGFASSGAFESLGESGTSYGNGDFT